MEKYHFFWNGKLSNWAFSLFIVDGITFNCGEQYMMYMKAITFNDTEIADMIMKESNPKAIKGYGRMVRNYDESVWRKVRYKIVKDGLKQKFLQNEDARKELLKYKGMTIVEASPYDRIWGIGYSEKSAMDNIDNWGENLLGKILTEISNEI